MITLVMLTNQLRNSGPNRVMLDIVRNVDRAKIRPVVISLRADDTVRPIAGQFEQLGVEIFRFEYNFWQLECLTWMVARKLENFITDKFESPVVQGHGYHPTLLTARMKLPHTITIHCISKEDFINSKGKLLGNYMVRRFGHNLRQQSYPVVISSYMADFYRKVCGSRLRLIYNGVSMTPTATDRNELRQRLALPADRKILLVTGGLTSIKNNLHIISRLKELPERNFLCIFLGIGEQAEAMKDAAHGDERFRFEGYKTNVAEYLLAADLYMSASLSEGLPLAVLEAVCMGTPALLSAIPPHSEIAAKIYYPGVATFSLEGDDIARKLLDMLAVDWDRNEISTRAQSFFSARKMGEQYGELIEEIANNQQ